MYDSQRGRRPAEREISNILAVTLSEFVDIDAVPPLSCGVYVMLNAAGDVLYVGQTGSFKLRMRDHERTKKWWPQVEKIVAYPCADADLRLCLEAVTILRYRPRHNRAIKIALKNTGDIYEIQFVGTSSYRKQKRKSS